MTNQVQQKKYCDLKVKIDKNKVCQDRADQGSLAVHEDCALSRVFFSRGTTI
jgi:hypothetical protein